MKYALNKNLSLLLGGQLVSQVGDKFYLLALSYWVLTSTGSPAKMSIVLAASLFPSLLLGFVSGAFIDRFSRKAIIVGTDLSRGLIVGFVALAYVMDFLSFSLIIVSQILLSINAAFFDPTIPAIIPGIVSKDQLSKANAKTQLIRGISSIAGPVLGGLTVAGLGYAFAFLFNAVSFLFSAFFEMFLKLPQVEGVGHQKGKPILQQAQSIRKEIIQGYRYILARKNLGIILVMVAVIHFFVGSFEVIIPVLAESLKGSGARNLGYFQAAFGAGAVLMAAVISFYNINNREARFLFSSVFLVGCGYISVSLLHLGGIDFIHPFLPVFLLTGGFIIMAGTCFKSLIQKNIEDRMAGRVFGVVSSVGNGSIPFAMMVYGFLLSYVQAYFLTLVTGLILLPLSLVFYNRYANYTNNENCDINPVPAGAGRGGDDVWPN